MEATLEILLELQHIDQRLKELDDPKEIQQLEELGFDWDPSCKDRLQELWKKRSEQVDAQLLDHYRELKSRYGEAIVPVDGGICLGCFMAIPTAYLQRVRENANVKKCHHCGRILYWVDP